MVSGDSNNNNCSDNNNDNTKFDVRTIDNNV